MARIDTFLEMVAKQNASDLHFVAGSPPILRLHGNMERIKFRTLTHEEVKGFIFEIMAEDLRKVFEEKSDADFAYQIEGVARFRVNAFMQRNGMGAVFRQIPTKIKTLEELGMPAGVKQFAYMKKGLVLVTGPTGSGKSTTLAAIIDLINRTRDAHIITIEDPLEFVHENQKSILTQREVGQHAISFSKALRAALREDPDVILVGEMRDLETISLAITCAETGLLVFGTLHTNSAPKTMDRIIDVFPVEQQEQIRVMLSDSLKGIVAQQLIKTADGKGRVAATEILVGLPALGNIIREGKTHMIASLMQTGKKYGMQTMDECLMKLLNEKKITPLDAYNKAIDKTSFEKLVKDQVQDGVPLS
ncbi:type IV pilus twitching motility protein PilT [bacterium]|nr:type IV pilus twitching motility protein PilT [bacterium]